MRTITMTGTNTPLITTTPQGGVWDVHGKAIFAYPNPGKTIMTFAMAVSGSDEVRVLIYNASGEKVADLKEPAAGAGITTRLHWNCDSAAPGVYLVRVLQGGKEMGKTKVAVMSE
jgi:hypothetical protein